LFNHCCGAHLTLNEAAASVGITLGSLLDALNRPAAATG
jgi:iron-sulfur cluster repair protein YtfE (RIC family)